MRLTAMSEEVFGDKPGTERRVMSATAMRDESVLEATMNAMILYEECGSAGKANRLLKRASDRADGATQWSVKPWRLDMLYWPPLAQDAQEGRGRGAPHRAGGLRPCGGPAPAAELAGRWAGHRQVQDAALAVFDGGNGGAFSVTAAPALCEFAQRYGLSFIIGDLSPAEVVPAEVWADLHEREVAQTATMAHILERVSPGSYQHWGINE